MSRPRHSWTRSWRGIKELWKLMDIEYDDFIRTTDERHVKSRAEDLQAALRPGRYLQEPSMKAGTARPASPSGRSFRLKDGKCARTADGPWKRTREESYFLKLS